MSATSSSSSKRERGDRRKDRTPFSGHLRTVLGEVKGVLARVSDADAVRLAEAILSARRVYLSGMGRSGLVASCFAMRLVHLGLETHVVGEATAPAIGAGDLLVAASGSGRTRTTIAQAKAAKAAGARIAVLTTSRRAEIARLAAVTVVIPGPSALSRTGSVQFGQSLFEQSLLVYLDAMVLHLAERLTRPFRALEERHSNLE